MGTSNSKPSNKTGMKVVKQKLDTASKTGVLSLREHNLASVPDMMFDLEKLRTLDLSHNKIKRLPAKLSTLINIKSLNCESNKLIKGGLAPISNLQKLTSLTLSANRLGLETDGDVKMKGPALPQLPSALKQLKLDFNQLTSIPKSIYSSQLVKLEKLDLSNNKLSSIPLELCKNLKSLTDLNLNNNKIQALPDEIGELKKLKSLSLQHNNIFVQSTAFSETNPQPLPASLFVETVIIDLNLAGNKMTNTQLNEFDGFEAFLGRRQTLKSKDIHGGALVDLSLCGLE